MSVRILWSGSCSFQCSSNISD